MEHPADVLSPFYIKMTFHEAQVFNVAQTYVLPLLKGKDR
jgi:hypothetical protein